jgi:hypothetical protein
MNETSKNKRGWRIMRRILISLAILATLIAIFYAEEDWRGKRAWQNCKRELEAKGMVLDWDKFIPPPVPDDQNFFMASTNILLRFHKAQTDAESAAATQSSWLRITYSTNSFPVFDTAKTGPLVVAEMTVESSATAIPSAGGSHSLVVKLSAADARKQLQDLIRKTVGRGVAGAAGFQFSELQLNNLAPAQIGLLSDTMPSVAELEGFIPEDMVTNVGHLRVEATDDKKFFQVVLTGAHITAAADYLKWSDRFVPALDEVREALKRPYAILPGDYSRPYMLPIPNFVTMRSIAQTLAQRAQCDFLLGYSEQALREVTLMHDLCRILEKPPTGQPMTLVEAMINVAISGLYASTVAEGFRLKAWHEPQVAALQEQFKEIKLVPTLADAFKSEQAASTHTLEITPASKIAELFKMVDVVSEKNKPSLWKKLNERLSDPMYLFFRFSPHGWIYQNMVTAASNAKGLDGVDLEHETISPRIYDQASHDFEKQIFKITPFNVWSRIAIPNFVKAWQTTAHNQTLANEGQIACALERYHLAHGEYPETLDVLVPQFIEKLPHDIIGGQPLHYRREVDGRFVLYSVGWNETDDGGQVAFKKDGSVDREKGDWVWQYPLK